MTLHKIYTWVANKWAKVRGIVPFISLISCLHKVYAEAPAPFVFSGNDDKNMIAFLRMDVREKMNSRKKSAEKIYFYFKTNGKKI